MALHVATIYSAIFILLHLGVMVSADTENSDVSAHGVQAEVSESTLRATSTGLSYAMGAELAWMALSPRARCLVKSRYQSGSSMPRVLVMPGAFDNAENVLGALRLQYELVTEEQLATEDHHLLNAAGKTLILNSGVELGNTVALQAIRAFVKRGGVLLTTNFAGEHLQRLFPHQDLHQRTLTTLGSQTRHVDLQVPAQADTRASLFLTQEPGKKRSRRQTDCLRSAPYLQAPLQDVHDRNLPALWAIEEAPFSISAERQASAGKAATVISSHDLRQPFDSVMSCFPRRKGLVYHLTGRLFQLPQKGGQRDVRANDNPLPLSYAMALLNKTLRKLNLSSRRLIRKALSRTPPSMQEVVSASLSSGITLQLLAREWQFEDASRLDNATQEEMRKCQ